MDSVGGGLREGGLREMMKHDTESRRPSRRLLNGVSSISACILFYGNDCTS